MQLLNGSELFSVFKSSIANGGVEAVRDGLIGEGRMLTGPMGDHAMIYADYVASGRALRQVETLIMDEVLPFYANSHTEGSHCGGFVTRARAASRALIAAECGADDRHAVVFCGAGATAGLNRLVHLLGVHAAVAAGQKPLILIGPYEHHSNILPWRESGAEVVEIPEAATGGPDLVALQTALNGSDGRLVIGAFSAGSNVTGILSDVDAVTRILKSNGALAVWDYAGAGPYVPIAMNADTEIEKDAVVTSPHKFLGGPGASGVFIIRKAAAKLACPSNPGGGTVRFVSPWGQDYSTDLTAREEAGTPNVLGDIRAGLAFAVKAQLTTDWMLSRHNALIARAFAAWDRVPNLRILGLRTAARLPFFSLRIEDAAGGEAIHHHIVTKALSDCFGIQARAGCTCAGPYGHRLLGIDAAESAEIRASILRGEDTLRPGWTRLNLSALMSDEKADKVIAAVIEIARDPAKFASLYEGFGAKAQLKAA